MAKELCACLEKRYTQLKNGDLEAMLIEYNSHLFKRGENVRLKSGAIAFECVIKSVSADGELEVTGGLKDKYRFGEVEWVI